MLSMTGFATITDTLVGIPSSDGQQISATCTIKALNGRYLEVTCKLPSFLQSLEVDCIRLLRQELRRGNIVLTLHVSNPSLLKGNVQPSLNMVNDYLNAIATIQHTYNIPGTITINELISLPNIFAVSDQTLDESIKKVILSLVKRTIDQVQITRSQEGAILFRDLEVRCTNMKSEIEKIEKASAIAIEQHKQKITALLQELEQSANELNKKLLEQQHHQLYDHLDKIIIHEEIVRFKNHLDNLLIILRQEHEEQGKRIDFTIQEMTREINTIGAKGNDAVIGTHTINIKLELEKIREQAQNIL